MSHLILSIHHPYVPTFLEKIVDKQIRGEALSFIEKLTDLVLSSFYCPYSCLANEKRVRIHPFNNGRSTLVDLTTAKIAGVFRSHAGIEAMTLNNHPVSYPSRHDIKQIISPKTDYVVTSEQSKSSLD